MKLKSKSVFDIVENTCYTTKYTNCIYQPKRNQITGEALKHIIKFIDWCLIESKRKTKK